MTFKDRRAARVLLIDDAGRALLFHGGDPVRPEQRWWFTPGGGLGADETPAQGAARELFEETGVRVDPDDLTAGNPNAIVHVVGVVDTIFFAEVPASETTLVVDGAEVLEAAWFPVDDLPHLTINTALLLGRFGIGPRA